MKILLITIWLFGIPVFAQHAKSDSISRIISAYDKTRKDAGETSYTLKDSAKVKLLFSLYGQIHTNDPARALKIANQSYLISKEIGFESGMSKALNQQANIYDYRSEHDKALQLFNQSLEIAEKLGDQKQVAQVEANIGVVFAKQGILNEALRHMLKALSIANHSKDIELQVGLTNNIAIMLQDQKRTKEALTYFKKCLDLQRLHKVDFGKSYVCQNIAEIYQQLKQDKIAKAYLEQGIKFAKAENNLISLANNYSTLGMIYLDADKDELAFFYFESALEIRQKLEDSFGLFSSYTNLGTYYQKMQNFEKALSFMTKAETLANQNGGFDMQAEVYRQFSSINRDKGNFKLALDYHEKFKQASDSVFNSENLRKLTEQQLNFDFRTEQQARDRAATKALAEQKLIRNLSIIGLSVLALLIIYVLVRRHRSKSREKQKQFDTLQTKFTHQEAEAFALRVENENIQLKNKLENLEATRQKQQLQEKLEFNQRELASTTLFLSQKNEMLSQLQQRIDELPKNAIPENQMERIKSAIQNNRYMDADWEKFRLHFEQVHPDFFYDLERKHSTLTTYELRLYAYLCPAGSSFVWQQKNQKCLAAEPKTRPDSPKNSEMKKTRRKLLFRRMLFSGSNSFSFTPQSSVNSRCSGLQFS
ncbi:tetratricopeptide repeat protein [Flavobacterium sp.]|uniref:tetratricopeptide repeat protein n=1 Tax=Flavobacterium sp. TaxID=239 RepID=UPI0025BC4549|nr:tetratricopeptide repeat protein [Flavobacterium sp.]